MPPLDKGKEGKIKKKPGRRQTSCAECRRLKLKCDRNVPCEKCVTRGCSQICPEGVLASTKGNRMVLSGTEELHERIDQLCARIRELEDALRTLQEQVSDEPHPLLNTNVLRPPTSLSRGPSIPRSSSASASSSTKSPPSSCCDNASDVKAKEEPEAVVIDAFGTMTIQEDGVSKYIGKTARSEYLIRADSPFSDSSDSSNATFPDLDSGPVVAGDQVYRRLPPFSRATHLCDIYLRHSKHLYAAIPRTELFDDVLMTVYRTHVYDSFQIYHSMALLFMVFSFALHFEGHREAREYYLLAKTTLGVATPVRQTTVASIQTLIHMAQYLDLSDWESGSAMTWLYMGHAVRLGFSMGLNLNPARWRLPVADVKKRIRVFWQLYLADTWTSFFFGRPPSISTTYIDCPLPEGANDVLVDLDDGTAIQTSFDIWIFEFTILMSSAMSTGMGPKQPSYSVVLDLDRQIRDFPVPVEWQATAARESPPPSLETHFYRWIVVACKESTLLNLHRPYLAQALSENTGDLQEHRYIASVVAAYRSSWRIVTLLQLTWTNASELIQRVNLPWSHGLSAAVVLCLLITRAPSSHLVPPALETLGRLLSLFLSASDSCRIAANLLPSIQRLYNKACESNDPSRYQPSTSASSSSITQAELYRLSGKTHLFKNTSESAMDSRHPQADTNPASPRPSLIPPLRPSSLGQAHPVLAQDVTDYSRRATAPTIPTLVDGGSNKSLSPGKTPTGLPEPLEEQRRLGSRSYPLGIPSQSQDSIMLQRRSRNDSYDSAFYPSSQSVPTLPHPGMHHPSYLPPPSSLHATGGPLFDPTHAHQGSSQSAVARTSSHPALANPGHFPGADPAYGLADVVPDRKYATMSNTVIPGFNPSIEMLDPSWQSLVDQLGY